MNDFVYQKISALSVFLHEHWLVAFAAASFTLVLSFMAGFNSALSKESGDFSLFISAMMFLFSIWIVAQAIMTSHDVRENSKRDKLAN